MVAFDTNAYRILGEREDLIINLLFSGEEDLSIESILKPIVALELINNISDETNPHFNVCIRHWSC